MPELQRQIQDVNGYAILGQSLDKSHSVLVLECNPATIDPLLSGTANQLPNLHSDLIHTDVITVNSEFEYQTRLNELKAAQMQYALVVVLGDGNATRLKLNENRALTWTEFTYQSLLPFEPEYLLLLSTADHREIPAHAFFEAVPMLKEVYSTTVSDTKLQSDVLKFMVSHLGNRRCLFRHHGRRLQNFGRWFGSRSLLRRQRIAQLKRSPRQTVACLLAGLIQLAHQPLGTSVGVCGKTLETAKSHRNQEEQRGQN